MARTSNSIRVSYPFHSAVDGELKRHAALTGISAAEIIRRAFDLYLTVEFMYNGNIPAEFVKTVVQPDGTPYPDTTKRITFYVDPYMAYKLRDWPDQEAHLLGYAIFFYVGMWSHVNAEDVAAGVDYVAETADLAGSDDATTDAAPASAPNDEDTIPNGRAGELVANPTAAEIEANEIEGVDQQGVASYNAPGRATGEPVEDDPNQEEGELFVEAEASMDHLDAEGNSTQDIHGNPVGTLYDSAGNTVNLDPEGNLYELDEYGYPVGTEYDGDGNPTNLDNDGFPVSSSATTANAA